MSAEMDAPKQSDGSPVPEWVWFDVSPFTSDHWDEYEFEDSVLFVRADVHKAEIERLGKVVERQSQIVAATEDERNTLTRQLQEAVEERDKYKAALEQFATNELSSLNCASVDVAASRVRLVARAALNRSKP